MSYPKNKEECYSNLGGINQKVSPYTTGPYEFLDLSNFDFTTLGALTKRPGTTQYIGATVTGSIDSLYEYSNLSGASYVVFSANTNLYSVSSSGVPSAFYAAGITASLFSFQTIVNNLFYANGNTIRKWDGSNDRAYSLPPGITTLSASVGSSGVAGFTGTYIYAYGYLNDRGYAGPGSAGITLNVIGATVATLSGMTFPSGFGVTAYVIYRTNPNGSALYEIATQPVTSGTQFLDTNLPITSTPVPTYQYFTLAPKYLEIFNNQLFLAGSTITPSTLYWSDVGEPEGIEPEFFAEVRTNDGDVITGMRSYLSQLLIFKNKSFSILNGTDPTNFTLSEISDQYGAVSNRAIVVWEQKCWFLDRKGIGEYNGANVEIVSTRIESIFQRMNLAAAKDKACAIHNRTRNEVWFAFPIDNSTVNNVVVVFDYIANAFTKFEGFNPASMIYGFGRFAQQTALFGGYSGALYNFGTSLFADSGNAISCVIKSHWFRDLGQSVQKQWRRLFLNVDSQTGITSALQISLYGDYSSTPGYTTVIYQNPFQTRIDFGISAKSLQLQVANSTTTDPIRLYGFTVESRFLRSV